jgi:hypothetical protein
VAGLPEIAVRLALLRVLDRDVRRVPNDDVILPTEQESGRLGLLDGEDWSGLEERLHGLRCNLPPGGIELGATDQAVSNRQAQRPSERSLEVDNLASVHRRDNQPESRDGHGIGVDVDPARGIERPLGQDGRVGRGLAFVPLVEQPPERAEDQVARAAGRVDRPDRLQAELVEGGREGVVQQEPLDEVGRLEQGVLLADLLREVLVEVAQEPRVELRCGKAALGCRCSVASRGRLAHLKRPEQGAGLGVDLPPGVQQCPGPVGGRAEGPERRLALGEQVPRHGDRADPAEDVQEVAAVGVVLGAGVQVRLLRVLGLPATVGGDPGQVGLGDQAVVLHAADEDAGQDPGHRHLLQVVEPPDLVRLRRPPGPLDRGEDVEPEPVVEVGGLPEAVEEVGL